ncbi:MAG: response regulator [Deltaproteobacteria bacterium]|nr:response regulator [Deltaproteobacteria bacterium]
MKMLIVDDNPVTSRLLKGILSAHGECDIAGDGKDAIQAFLAAHEKKKPYDLICMDIMMPKMDGNVALVQIRELEKKMGIKNTEEARVLMISDLSDGKSVTKAYYEGGATSYMVKPIEKDKLLDEIHELGLI